MLDQSVEPLWVRIVFSSLSLLIILFGLGFFYYYWYLSWFNPAKLRELEKKRLGFLNKRFCPRYLAAQLKLMQQDAWLQAYRIAFTIGLLPFTALIIFLILKMFRVI